MLKREERRIIGIENNLTSTKNKTHIRFCIMKSIKKEEIVLMDLFGNIYANFEPS